MEYEVIREIPNSCQNNQMRDVSFDEVECDDPVEYVRAQFRGKMFEISEDRKPDGSVVIYVTVDRMIHKYMFTAI